MKNKNQHSLKKYLILFFVGVPASIFAANTENSPAITSNISATQTIGADAEMAANPTLLPEIWLGVINSSVYGSIAHSQYANFLTPRDVATFLIDYGPDQFRMDLTWAHILTANQRFKLSAQHFAQSNDFQFVTTPSGGEYIGQNSVGAEYEYAFANRWLQVLNLQAYYFSANNGDLADIPYSPDGVNSFIDQRTLVGGEGGGFSVGPRWQVWSGGEFSLAANYDQVNFDTQTTTALKNSEGLGGTARFRQQLSPSFEIELMATSRQPYNQYSAELNWIAHQSPSHRLGLQLTASHLDSDVLPAGNENILGLSIFYRWDGKTRISRQQPMCFAGNACDLIRWASQSAAYMPGVYVQKDEKIIPQ